MRFDSRRGDTLSHCSFVFADNRRTYHTLGTLVNEAGHYDFSGHGT